MYGAYDVKLLRKAFEAIRGELGGTQTAEALSALDVQDLATAARIALDYYDRTYEHGLQKRAGDNRHPVPAQGLSIEDCAKRLMAAADGMGL
jgi:tRNA 2-selenouridine synthase